MGKPRHPLVRIRAQTFRVICAGPHAYNREREQRRLNRMLDFFSSSPDDVVGAIQRSDPAPRPYHEWRPNRNPHIPGPHPLSCDCSDCEVDRVNAAWHEPEAWWEELCAGTGQLVATCNCANCHRERYGSPEDEMPDYDTRGREGRDPM